MTPGLPGRTWRRDSGSRRGSHGETTGRRLPRHDRHAQELPRPDRFAHRLRVFTVRHRLPRSSLTSPYGPFVVELFAASRLTRSPGWYTPDWPVARLSAPHVSQVERTQSGPDPLDRIWPSIRRCRPSPALNHDGLSDWRGHCRPLINPQPAGRIGEVLLPGQHSTALGFRFSTALPISSRRNSKSLLTGRFGRLRPAGQGFAFSQASSSRRPRPETSPGRGTRRRTTGRS